MTQYAIAVRHTYAYQIRYRPVLIEVDKVTACFVFAAGFWNRRVRYDKNDYKFRFFDDKETAEREFHLLQFRCEVFAAEHAEKEAKIKRQESDAKIAKVIAEW